MDRFAWIYIFINAIGGSRLKDLFQEYPTCFPNFNYNRRDFIVDLVLEERSLSILASTINISRVSYIPFQLPGLTVARGYRR